MVNRFLVVGAFAALLLSLQAGEGYRLRPLLDPLFVERVDGDFALYPLDAITGKTTADDILNRIFSTFCIGK